MEDARHTAFLVLHDVLTEGTYFNLALKKRLKAVLSAEDRRFAASLAALTLEHMLTLDYLLKPFITAKRVHAGIRNILRMGACQMRYMHVPESAAVDESVKLAKKTGKGALAGFVNAVLRSFARGHTDIALPQEEKDTAQYISVAYGFPLWMVERFTADYGYDAAKAFFSHEADLKDTSVRMNALKTNTADFEKALREQGLSFRKCVLAEAGYHIENMADIEETALYREGLLTVMGEASMTAVQALAPYFKEGASLLDACAAPGGKSAYAAAMAGNGLHITAWDIHPHRTELMRKNFERLGVMNTRIAVKDAAQHDAEYDGRFDIVLLDAPCSALGLVHKKPDIRVKRRQEDIAALGATQRALLSACAGYVKKGGLLAYFTCTVLKEENEYAVDSFLREDGRFKPADTLKLPERLAMRASGGRVLLMPHLDGTDGFFISLMERFK